MSASTDSPRHARRIDPPGTILQNMYLNERLAAWRPADHPGEFIEVGVGDGRISQLLLGLGWSGEGYELSEHSADAVRHTLDVEIANGEYAMHNDDWLLAEGPSVVDLVISSMVLEHLPDADEDRFLQQCRSALKPSGKLVLLVPGSPEHWGIEDEIAGHHRRYTVEGITARLDALGWEVTHTAGLTYPLSNLLLPLSNMIVKRAERYKQDLSMMERTKLSGQRTVLMKTRFPGVARALLNETMMRPMHYLQKRNRHHPHSMIVYVEARPRTGIA